MLTATHVIPPEQCFIFPPTQICRPPLKTSILSDQSQHRAAAGLHSSDLHREVCWDKTLSGTVKQDSSHGAIDCHSSERGDWLPEYFALQTSHFLCTQTRTRRTWGECVVGGHEWQLRMPEKVGEEVGGGGSVSREVWWGSSGPPGQMAVPVGIHIKHPPPPNCFHPVAIKTLSGHHLFSRFHCASSLLLQMLTGFVLLLTGCFL